MHYPIKQPARPLPLHQQVDKEKGKELETLIKTEHLERNKTPAKHRDIFRLIKKKSGRGEIRTQNLLIDSNLNSPVTKIVK